MTQENQFDDWVLESSVTESASDTIRKRWCPTHRRNEDAVVGARLRCGPAWRDQYALEREVEAERMSVNAVMLKTAQSIDNLAEEIRNGERVIAEPPSRPAPPQPPPPPAPRRASGRGGVALP